MIIRAGKQIIRRIVFWFFKHDFMTSEEMKQTWHNAKTCCILSASGIGDAIMATPLLAAIKSFRPEIQLVVISSMRCKPVFLNNPAIDRLLIWNRKSNFSFIKLILQLRKVRLDVFFAAQPSNTISHSLISALSRTKLKLKHSYNYNGSPERDFSFVYSMLLPDRMDRHRVELNLDFLRVLGENVIENTFFPNYFISKKTQNKIDSILAASGIKIGTNSFIAIHPGGVRTNKRWAHDRFSIVIKHLVLKNIQVLLVGGKDECGLSINIQNEIQDIQISNFVGQLSLQETAALLRKCSMLISNDTGIMHLATAVGTPIIALYGPTDPRHIGPYSKKSTILHKSGNINEISSDEVIEVIQNTLSKN